MWWNKDKELESVVYYKAIVQFETIITPCGLQIVKYPDSLVRTVKRRDLGFTVKSFDLWHPDKCEWRSLHPSRATKRKRLTEDEMILEMI